MECPNKCHLWARLFDPNKPLTAHHPNCSHVDDSLIEVFKVSDGSSHFYTDEAFAAETEAENVDDVTITKVKMHREVYGRLPEFAGF